MKCYLVGDIGGTNARFALFQEGLGLIHQQTLKCADYDNLEFALEEYMQNGNAAQIDGERKGGGKGRGEKITIAGNTGAGRHRKGKKYSTFRTARSHQ